MGLIGKASDAFDMAGDVFDKAEDAMSKAAHAAERTGKYVKLKAQIAEHNRRRDFVVNDIGEFALESEDFKQKLKEEKPDLFDDLSRLDRESEDLKKQVYDIKREGLFPDDEDDPEVK